MNYSKFIIWWCSLLLISAATFWAYYFGLIDKIWKTDVTMITSIIAIVFILTNIHLGRLAWRLRQDFIGFNSGKYRKSIHNRLETVWFVSEQLMALGMLGTVIGLIHMLSSNSVSQITDANMQSVLADMWKSMGLALYTNAVGLITSITLKAQVYMLGYGFENET